MVGALLGAALAPGAMVPYLFGDILDNDQVVGLLTGTPAEVIDQAAEWRDHGLRYAVMANASGLQPSLRRGLAASVPFARILRGLRKL